MEKQQYNDNSFTHENSSTDKGLDPNTPSPGR